MIPGDFHRYKITFEPLGFAIFCMHGDFTFNFSPGKAETPSVDTRRRDSGGLSKVHEHAKETLGSVRSADTNHPNVGL